MSSTPARQTRPRCAPQSVAAGSPAVDSGLCLQVAGHAMRDAEGNLSLAAFAMKLQAVYADIEATLARQGLSPRNVIKETVFTTDLRALVSASSKRLEFYRGSTPTASTYIAISRRVQPRLLLEVEVVAVKRR